MEPRLIAYARQRREAMGAELELPPAARQTLLAEVVRKDRPGTATEPSAWGIFWRRLAWTGGIGAAAVLVLLPMLRHAPTPAPKAVLGSANDQTSRRELALDPSAPSTISAPATPAILPVTSQSLNPARPRPLPDLTPSLTPESSRNETQMASDRQNRDESTLGPQPGPPAQPLARALADRPAADPTASQAAVSAGVGGAPAILPGTREAVPVMNAFEWRQEGSAIRIRDADGSMYVGEVVSDKSRAPEVALKTLTAKTPQLPSPALRQRAPAAAPLTREPLSQNVFFRAAGTNRSLNQQVEIEGELAADLAGTGSTPGQSINQAVPVSASGKGQAPATLSQAPAGYGNRQPSQGADPNYLHFQNTAIQTGNIGLQNRRAYSNQANPSTRNAYPNQRIQGQATVGGTNRIVIDAIPAE